MGSGWRLRRGREQTVRSGVRAATWRRRSPRYCWEAGRLDAPGSAGQPLPSADTVQGSCQDRGEWWAGGGLCGEGGE